MVSSVDEEDQIGSRSATAEHSSESEDDHDDVNPATTMVNKTGLEIKMKSEDKQKTNKNPVVAIRGKVSVGKANRVNTDAPAEYGQSINDVRREESREERRTGSTAGSGAPTAIDFQKR